MYERRKYDFPFSTQILEIFHPDVCELGYKNSREAKQAVEEQWNRGKWKRKKKLTTPTLTLLGLGSAKKASVTPRIGSLGAGSTLFHQDEMNLAPIPKHLRLFWFKTFLEIVACNAMERKQYSGRTLFHCSSMKFQRERRGEEIWRGAKREWFRPKWRNPRNAQTHGDGALNICTKASYLAARFSLSFSLVFVLFFFSFSEKIF